MWWAASAPYSGRNLSPHGGDSIRRLRRQTERRPVVAFGNVTELTGLAVEIGGNGSHYRDLVTDFFRSQRAEYEIRAQLCTDLERMPVENASVLWDPELSPHLPVARLIFEPQDTYSPARRVYGDE